MEHIETKEQMPATSEEPMTLPSFTALWTQAYQFTRNRIDLVGWYVAITIAALVLFALPIVVGGFIISFGQPALIALGVAIVFLGWAAALWVLVVASAGLMFAVATGDGTAFKVGWQWAKPKFWIITWIGLLISLVLLAGFSLLIVPGIIIMVYTLFYFLVFIRSDQRGLHALAASTHIVYGHFWPVVGRIVLFGLVISAINLAITAVFMGIGYLLTRSGTPLLAGDIAAAGGEIIGMVVSLFFTIMMMRYMADLHAALAVRKPGYQPQPLTRSYKLYRGLAWLALILIVVSTIAVSALLQAIGGLEGIMEVTTPESVYDEAAFEAELEAELEQIDIE